MVTLVWLRNDLRVADNPALAWAAARGEVVPVYILEDSGPRPLGAAARWWLHQSLTSLREALPGLVLRRGDARAVLPALVADTGASAVAWNRRYEGPAQAIDRELKETLLHQGIEVHSFKGNLLFEPWEVVSGGGTPFKVFTPFWRACMARQADIGAPLPPPAVRGPRLDSDHLDDWDLRPRAPDWAAGWERLWQPGEPGAGRALATFIERGLNDYANLRDRPDLTHTSRLSPHLRFGEISPRQIWAALSPGSGRSTGDSDKFLSEVGWREFCHHLLNQQPDLATRNWKPAFDAYPWQEAPALLRAWQRGRTGYPLVDAGMCELWATGWMHNRVRMVAASFLTKHLRIDWRLGEQWFWDTLLDADPANNPASWQWVAGSGADAAPYFRIFNPTGQAASFDPAGDYIRRWCPELARLPTEHLFAPWEAPATALAAAGVKLGRDYPLPVVDHAEARAAALAGYAHVKAAGA